MDDQTKQPLPSNDEQPSAPSSAPETPEPKPVSSAVSDAKPVDTTAFEKKVAEANARAERLEKQYRELQATKDREIAETRKQAKERLAKDRAELAAMLEQGGFDANHLRAYQARGKEIDEREELEDKARRYEAQEQQRQADQYKRDYIARAFERVGIDPQSDDAQELQDAASPEAFDFALKVYQKQRGKAQAAPVKNEPPPEPKEEPKPVKTVSPLSGVGTKTEIDDDAEMRKRYKNTGRLADYLMEKSKKNRT